MSITITDAEKAFVQRFLDEWTGTATTPARLALENESFTPPASGAWVRLSSRVLDREQITLGDATVARRFRTTLQGNIQIFGDLDEGKSATTILADEAIGIYESVRFGGDSGKEIDCIQADKTPIPPDGAWFGQLVRVRMDFEEAK